MNIFGIIYGNLFFTAVWYTLLACRTIFLLFGMLNQEKKSGNPAEDADGNFVGGGFYVNRFEKCFIIYWDN
jgi:hypothetical protein